MPHDITFEHLPAGVCVEASRAGGMAKICAYEFVSEEDGDQLIARLEGFASDILAKLPSTIPIQPSEVKHLLAIIRRDKTATVYLNELEIMGSVQMKRTLTKGDFVFVDDIADVHRLTFKGIEIPKDAGIVLVFSVGWRRAMFYDLIPLQMKEQKDRDYDIEAQLATFYSYLLFQGMFKITEQQWKSLFDDQWFPFITLKTATIKTILAHASNNWPLDELSESIAQEIRDILPTLLFKWKNVATFAEHIPFLEKAVERYLSNDFISTTAILYPRIEGLMRTHQRHSDPSGQSGQKGLVDSAVKDAEINRNPHTPLLPDKFRTYLENVYFSSFDPKASKIKVSRNSVGHGVASADECTLKSASISLLLIDQLSYYFSAAQHSTVTQPAPPPPYL